MTKTLGILNSSLIAIMFIFIGAKNVSASGNYDEAKVPQYTLPG
jgi:hypothetical protein